MSSAIQAAHRGPIGTRALKERSMIRRRGMQLMGF